MEAKNLILGDGAATIGTTTFGGGDGGTINVTVAEALTIAGMSAGRRMRCRLVRRQLK